MAQSKDLEVMLGEPHKAILSMAGPLLISYLIIEANTFMDLTWCSGLGSACTSAVASISPMTWIATGLGTGIGVGASAAIAGALANEHYEKGNSLAAQTLFISVVLALFCSFLMFFAIDPLIDMMGVTDIRRECHSYIEPMAVGAVFIVLNGVVAGILRAEGASKKSTVVLISSALIHMALDPIFIIILGMGLTGAAVATVIAMSCGVVIGLSWFVRGRMVVHIGFRGFKPRTDEIMLILSVGIPRAFEILLVSIMSMIQRIFVVECGGTQAAMFYNLPWNFVTLSQSVSMALGSALIPIAAAAVSVKKSEKSETAYHYALKLSMIFMIGIAVVVFIFADYFVFPFTYSGEMAQYKSELVHVMRIYMLIVPFMGLIDVSSSMLQSMRHANLSMVSSFIRNLVIIFALWWACTVSLDAIYWSLVVCEIFGAALMVYFAHIVVKRIHAQFGEFPEGASS